MNEATARTIPDEEVRPKTIGWSMDPDIQTALTLAARCFKVTVEAVASRDRHKCPAAARHVFWWAVRETWGLSYPEIGRLFPTVDFDHTTVMSGAKRVERALLTPEGDRRIGIAAAAVLEALGKLQAPTLYAVPGEGLFLRGGDPKETAAP